MIDLPSPPPDDLLAAAADAVPLAFLDFETTGLYPASGDRVCEVAILRVEPGRKRPRKLSQLVNPEQEMPSLAQSIHHIGDEMLQDAPLFADVVPRIAALLEGAVVLVTHDRHVMGAVAEELVVVSKKTKSVRKHEGTVEEYLARFDG